MACQVKYIPRNQNCNNVKLGVNDNEFQSGIF